MIGRVRLRYVLLCAAAIAVSGCRSSDSGDAADAGPGGPTADAAPQSGCDPYELRPSTPEVFVGPDGIEDRLMTYIEGATDELYVMMYLLTLDQFVDAFIAAHERGVDVRILLDRDHEGNVDSRNALLAAGVPVRISPESFTHSHSKVFLIDGDTALVMSGNLNYYSMVSERNYGIVNTDADDIADIRAIFESDWLDDGSFPDLSCTRLLVSPINARQRVLDHINGAIDTLDMTVMYISDDSVRTAVVDAAERGVAVRVLLADPSWIDDNYTTADTLAAAGIPVRFLYAFQLHAKLVIADGVPLIGSQNMSFTSLNRNREIGAIVGAESAAQVARQQLESDWALGVAE